MKWLIPILLALSACFPSAAAHPLCVNVATAASSSLYEADWSGVDIPLDRQKAWLERQNHLTSALEIMRIWVAP